MCGIAGNLNFGGGPITQGRIKGVLKSMHHRGPDSDGFYQTSVGGCFLSLLHTRLSIIDTTSISNQPFLSNNCVLIFNGEIFNYIELREELKGQGITFKTHSDTEVIIKSYLAWGINCVEKFEGMWSYALYDIKKKKLILSRDRFGEKPLFIYTGLKTYSFASEISALSLLTNEALSPNKESIKRLLVNGYKSIYKQAETFVEGVREIPPATNVIISMDSDGYTISNDKRYWNLKYNPYKMKENEVNEVIKEKLISAVKIRMRSDVPLAFCLSGGVDSSTIAGIACKVLNHSISTFSIIDDDERYNETDEINLNLESLKSRHFFIKTDKTNFIERLERQIAFRNAPVFTLSYFMHAQISESMKKEGFKVSLSGTGADELFTGYYDHYNFWLAEMSNEKNFKDLINDWNQGYGKNVRNDFLKDPLCFVKHPNNRDYVYPNRSNFNEYLYNPLKEKILEHDFSSNVLRNRMMNELFQEFVPVALHEDDFNSMSYSVENRSPFLDSKLVEFAFSIPNQLLVREGMLKWPLRALGEGIVPDKVRLNKFKKGFNASILSLIDFNNPKIKERVLSDSLIFDLIKRDRIEMLLKNNNFQDNELSKFIFSFISAKLFLEQPLFNNR